MSTASTPMTIRIDKELRGSIEKICDSKRRSRNYIAKIALQEYVDRNAWKIQALKDAAKEADKGEFISHEAMGKWIHSLGTDNELPRPEIDVFKKPVGEK